MPAAGEHEGQYARDILASRAIPEAIVSKLIARGLGVAIGEGKTLHRHVWAEPNGQGWGLCAITMGGRLLTSWMERE